LLRLNAQRLLLEKEILFRLTSQALQPFHLTDERAQFITSSTERLRGDARKLKFISALFKERDELADRRREELFARGRGVGWGRFHHDTALMRSIFCRLARQASKISASVPAAERLSLARHRRRGRIRRAACSSMTRRLLREAA